MGCQPKVHTSKGDALLKFYKFNGRIFRKAGKGQNGNVNNPTCQHKETIHIITTSNIKERYNRYEEKIMKAPEGRQQ